MRAALMDLGKRLPELADDLRLLADLHEQPGASARESALGKARTIVDKVCKQLCEKKDVSWGKQNPTIENMIGPLVAAKVIPGLIAAHVRTVQSYGNLAAHGEAVSAEHVELGCKALVAFLQWHAGGDAPADKGSTATATEATTTSRRMPLLVGGGVAIAAAGVAVMLLRGKHDDKPGDKPAGTSAQTLEQQTRTSPPLPTPGSAQQTTAPGTDTQATRGRPETQAPPLVVELSVVTPNGAAEKTLAPGAKLHTGDKVAFRVQTSDDAYVYITQDKLGQLDTLFPGPASDATEPIAKQAPLRIPTRSWFKLADDGAYGTMRITVVASRTPQPDLAAALESVAAQEGKAQRQGVQQWNVALEKLADPTMSEGGVKSRGHLELLDDTERRSVSVRYTQRPGDALVIATFDLTQVK